MNRINWFAAVMLISFPALSFAQNGPSFIGISGGAAFPFGTWSQSKYIVSTTGYVNDPAGFAGTGGFGDVEGAYFFSKNWGVGAMIRYGTFKVKDIDTLSAGYRESFDVDQVTTTASNYKMWNFLPGVYFNLPLTDKLSLTARGLLGITSATTPLIQVDVEDGGIDDGTFEQKASTASSFGFDLGAGLSYDVAKNLAINLRGDFNYSKPDFTIENTQRQNAAGRLITEYNEPLTNVGVSLGLAYVFHEK